MKSFNQEIQVTVSVDSIANQLLDTMNPEFKHASLVVESIIGRMLSEDKGALSLLYNSLNGYDNDINFNVGDIVKISNLNKYSYWHANESGEYVRSSKDIKTVEVIDINPYSNSKLKVEYTMFNSKGEEFKETEWVQHTRCEFIGYAEDIKEVAIPLNL